MEIKKEFEPQDYLESIKIMEKRVEEIISGKKEELIWFLDYPSIYTTGSEENNSDLLIKNKLPLFKSNRGGKLTYHGPGQRVVYLMMDLNTRKKDIRAFVHSIENIILKTLINFEVKAKLDSKHHGVFVQKQNGNNYKIASIGLKFKNWVTYHGFSININTNLNEYEGIRPCGLDNKFVTSLSDLGINIENQGLDDILVSNINKEFK